MVSKLVRVLTIAIAMIPICFAYAQTEEEDMNFAVAHMGLQLSRLVQGDTTDRSETFPRGSFGEVTKNVYRFVRTERMRVSQLDERRDPEKIEIIASLGWTSSPKAAIRNIQRASLVYGRAKIAQKKAFEEFSKRMERQSSDSLMVAEFKRGVLISFQERMIGGELDTYTPYLIFLAKLEEVYHLIDQNRGDIELTVGPYVVFKSEPLNIAYQQKVDSMSKVAQGISEMSDTRQQELQESLKKMKNAGRVNG